MADEALPFVDPDTEAQLLAAVVQRNSDILRSGLIADLDQSQFSVPAFKWFVENMLDDSKDPPAWPIVHEKIVATYPDLEEQEKQRLTLQRLYELELTFVEDAVASFRRFIAFQSASSSVRSSFEGYARTRNVDLTLRSLQQGVGESMRILEGSQLQVVDYGENWLNREAQRRNRRNNPDLYPRLRMGISQFDAQVKMEAGTVTNFLAPAKRHKSIILTSLAYAAVLQGFNVALVVVENSVELTEARLDSMFLQLNYDRVCAYLKTAEEKAYADAVFQRVNSWPQRLKIVKGEPQKTGCLEVERELRVLKESEGFVANVKLYDYLNIMKPSRGSKRGDDWQAQTQIVWDMQAVAKAEGEEAVVVTASQTNVAGLATDKEGKPIKVQAQHQGRSIGITQGVDATVAIDISLGQKPSGPNDDGKDHLEMQASMPPTIILSPLYLRDGAITDPEIRLTSQIDRMCVSVEQRKLWDEVDDGQVNPQFPADLVV